MYNTYFGLACALISVVLAILLEGASLGSFFKFSALLLILGGTLGATWASYSSIQIKTLLETGRIIFSRTELPEIMETFLRLLEKTRRDGLLSLEDEIENIPDELIQKGLRLIVDGTDPMTVEEILMEWSEEKREKEHLSSKILETAGGFCPTVGIIGTVMGLVHVLENLGAGTAALGQGIATAFIATFYGIGFANLIFLPLSNKIKSFSEEETRRRNAVIRGLLSIQSGDNKRILLERMSPFLH
ncbi:MAG TPA: MotA/TolQ/ExbB proton channel family protein [Leptospiraceae bacterium]|nr:MotA/TolQ/ExbB proton channel family protein [Leptospiraceae bacterium]HMZ58557.1 MotA/TolQ/ExbB proton channel family protein [Leptospiraceae bacterium]HNF15104.1 MotA/TolQ/ExbB proton channel family protein [Leptospiraceae bacterium]HNF26022.1 MotA/TolQ/ExbB proton channel family protein [Leptospiraceae bacterium]HNM02999.1 MotA/TolQ/ExbB proton channel family protein [Leptospiraceae bacterium]